MDLADFTTELNIRIGDTDNFTFTPEEKTSALTEAINDEYVVVDNWDSSLTFQAGVYQYVNPVDVITGVYLKPDNSLDEPEEIDGKYWEVVGSNLQFKNRASEVIPVGYRLYLRSKTKSGSGDTITDVGTQEYILSLAQFRLYRTLLNKKNFRFLKNDTSVAEIVTAKQDLEKEVNNYRRRLPRQFQLG
jgi:hypothetical protein